MSGSSAATASQETRFDLHAFHAHAFPAPLCAPVLSEEEGAAQGASQAAGEEVHGAHALAADAHEVAAMSPSAICRRRRGQHAWGACVV